jgi:hypothetical protein
MGKLSELVKKDRGFFYALPALVLMAFHMIVDYAVRPAGPGIQSGDLLPGLMEGLIGVVLYGGLFFCVLMAIITRRCAAVLEFIATVTVARLLLPVIGMIGGELVIGFVVVCCLLIVTGGALAFVLSGLLSVIFGGTVGAGLGAAGIAAFVLPIMGVIVIITMAVSILTGAFEGMGLLGSFFTHTIPLL